jgi:hypothetical protein
MRHLIIAGLALAALSGAFGEARADANHPWCIIGYHRSVDCSFSSREQCVVAAINIGVARRCFQNPFYSPERASFVAGTGPDQQPDQRKPHRNKAAVR